MNPKIVVTVTAADVPMSSRYGTTTRASSSSGSADMLVSATAENSTKICAESSSE